MFLYLLTSVQLLCSFNQFLHWGEYTWFRKKEKKRKEKKQEWSWESVERGCARQILILELRRTWVLLDLRPKRRCVMYESNAMLHATFILSLNIRSSISIKFKPNLQFLLVKLMDQSESGGSYLLTQQYSSI